MKDDLRLRHLLVTTNAGAEIIEGLRIPESKLDSCSHDKLTEQLHAWGLRTLCALGSIESRGYDLRMSASDSDSASDKERDRRKLINPIYDSNAVEIAMRSLHAFPESPNVQAHALDLLANLSEVRHDSAGQSVSAVDGGKYTVHKLCKEMGFHDKVLAVIQKHIPSAGVQEAGLKALKVIGEKTDFLERLENLHAIDTLLAGMDSHPRNRHIQRHGCDLVKMLSYDVLFAERLEEESSEDASEDDAGPKVASMTPLTSPDSFGRRTPLPPEDIRSPSSSRSPLNTSSLSLSFNEQDTLHVELEPMSIPERCLLTARLIAQAMNTFAGDEDMEKAGCLALLKVASFKNQLVMEAFVAEGGHVATFNILQRQDVEKVRHNFVHFKQRNFQVGTRMCPPLLTLSFKTYQSEMLLF